MKKEFKIEIRPINGYILNELKKAGLVRKGQVIRKDKRAQIYRRAIDIFELRVEPTKDLTLRSLCFALTGILEEIAPDACFFCGEMLTLFPEWRRYIEEEIGQERFEEGGYYWPMYEPSPRIEALNKMLSYM